jgi:hypothetical protein
MTNLRHHKTPSVPQDKMGREKIDLRKQRQARLERREDSALALHHLSLLGFIRMNI